MEKWKAIDGYPGYEVSTEGSVKSYRRVKIVGKLIKPNYAGDPRVYPQVQLYSGQSRPDMAYVAKLVSYAFLDGYNGQTIHYRDGNPRNVRVSNLYFYEEE